jgi:hypothetical protein
MLRTVFIKKYTRMKHARARVRMTLALVCVLLFQTAVLFAAPADLSAPLSNWQDLIPGPGVLPGTCTVSLSDSRQSAASEGFLCSCISFLQSAAHPSLSFNFPVLQTPDRLTLRHHTRRYLL